MCVFHDRRFVLQADAQIEQLPWGKHTFFCRPGLVDTQQLIVVQVDMPPGTGHRFHKHPGREEVLLVLDGEAEQWVEKDKLWLRGGDSAFIPSGAVHGIYNDSPKIVRFLAMLSPAVGPEPLTVDVFDQDPWRSLRAP